MTEQLEMRLPPTRMVKVADLKPYVGNPRTLPPAAVEKLGKVMAKYGYKQPIVVEPDNTIIVGHTRHQALLALGVDEVEVVDAGLVPELAREYRVVDNRVAELATWEYGDLTMELRAFDDDELRLEFFPNVDLEISSITNATKDVTDAAVTAATKKITTVKDEKIVHTTGVICPACTQRFEVSTATLPGLSRLDLEVLSRRDRARPADAG
jgi:hypothetical protein